MQDVVIVGGSFAGLSAALQLGRARRRVTVLDTATPRNRFAAHAHGILGHDGKPRHQILGEAIAQLRRYGSVRFVQAGAQSVSGEKDGFAVVTTDGETMASRRVLLSHGIADIMPDIEGFAECWGRSVLHCPYCHGFEVADRRLGVLFFPPAAAHVTSMLRDWSDDLTLFANGLPVEAELRALLERRGTRLVEAPIARIRHHEGQLSAIDLAGGEVVGLDALFAAPRQRPSSPLYRQLGLVTEAGPLGDRIRISDTYETSAPGIYAAGDLASMMQSVPMAMAGGNLAGVHCHHSLLD